VSDSGRLEYSVCPRCHTADTALTTAALAAGGGWQCQRCQHHWTSQRLATAAAYEAWSSARSVIA
jgi:transposase-like protein